MEVILLQDVPKIGKRFDVKEVPDGHALNKLIPEGLAEPAKPENLKRIKVIISKAEVDGVAAESAFAEAIDVLSDRTLTLEVGANDKGHLFEAIKAEAIVAAAKEEGVSLSPDKLIIEKPIKEVGSHTIVVKSGDQSGTIDLEVVAK